MQISSRVGGGVGGGHSGRMVKEKSEKNETCVPRGGLRRAGGGGARVHRGAGKVRVKFGEVEGQQSGGLGIFCIGKRAKQHWKRRVEGLLPAGPTEERRRRVGGSSVNSEHVLTRAENHPVNSGGHDTRKVG